MAKFDKDKIKGVAGKGKGFIEEFKAFVLKGNVMDMAVGVIIGTAFANNYTTFHIVMFNVIKWIDK